MNGSSRLILRIFGVKLTNHEQAHSEEELKIIMNQSYQSGEINQTELDYMRNIFLFDERVARDIMVPRVQIVVLDEGMNREEILTVIDTHHFTRYPITENGNKDCILGVVNTKEMTTQYALGKSPKLSNHIHKIPFIHESASLQDVLLKMKKDQIHMALVVDEYGGTSGIITMEDILEEIVGEIRDEFDSNEIPDISPLENDEYLINGRVLLEELENEFGIHFANDYSMDTIGGWMQVQLLELENQQVPLNCGDYELRVNKKDKHQILQISMKLRNRVEEISS